MHASIQHISNGPANHAVATGIETHSYLLLDCLVMATPQEVQAHTRLLLECLRDLAEGAASIPAAVDAGV